MSRMRRELLECQVGTVVVDGQERHNSGAGDENNIHIVQQCFCLPASFVGFSGHFPGYPIVPAVVQIFMAQLVAEQYLRVSKTIGSVERAKFLRQLKPDDAIDVCCQRKTVRGRDIVDATLFVDDELVAAFWLVDAK